MWYSKEVVGETYIKQFMPKLTAALDTVHVTNGQIRRGAIEKMARNGISDRNIAKASGHKSLKTLDNYNVGLTIDEQFKMATIVGTSGINTKVVAKKPANSTDFEFSYDTEMSEEDMLAIADETPDEGSPAKKKFKKSSDGKLVKKSSKPLDVEENKENSPMSNHVIAAPMSNHVVSPPMSNNVVAATMSKENSVSETLTMPSSTNAQVTVTDQFLLAYLNEQSLQLQRQNSLFNYINTMAQKK